MFYSFPSKKVKTQASRLAENVNTVSGSDTVTANQAHFWFCHFRSGNFDVKAAPLSGRPIVENVVKIMEILDRVSRHASTYPITTNYRLARKPFGTICIRLVSRRSSLYELTQ